MRVPLTVALIAALVAAAAYLGSYFAVVRRGPIMTQSGTWCAVEEYPKSRVFTTRGLEAFYQFANRLDRRFLRASVWAGRYDFVTAIRGGTPWAQSVPK